MIDKEKSASSQQIRGTKKAALEKKHSAGVMGQKSAFHTLLQEI
jgi:hypothetical protein